MLKIKHCSRYENKVNENKVLYCKALRCETLKNNKNCFPSIKLTNLLAFKLDFQKVDQHMGASGWSSAPNAARTISWKAWNPPAETEYPSRECIHNVKESKGNMFNPIFKGYNPIYEL